MIKTCGSKLQVYSLYDNSSLTYEGLYLFPNDDTALRGLRHCISQIPFPEDKDVIFVGLFDVQNGLLESCDEDIVSIGRLVPGVNNDK